MNTAQVLQLNLHQQLVGYIIGFHNGKNIVLFDPSFRDNPYRPTLGLMTYSQFPHSEQLLKKDWLTQQRLAPLFSNLLPEGALRTLLAHQLKIHHEHEFQFLSALGQDLSGALIAEALVPEDVPDWVQQHLHLSGVVEMIEQPIHQPYKFSLAGVQMKFSMQERQQRFTLTQPQFAQNSALGDWIVKTSTPQHPYVPANEYTAMSLAKLVGVDIPEIRLVKMFQLENLPSSLFPAESYAFAIQRFDRLTMENEVKRIHIEDFAQVLNKYPHEKYNSANYEQIGRIIYQFSANPIADIAQFARRLLVNILLANGDAHLKNWSLIYRDKITPTLAPAYDIVTTAVYIENEQQFALNLAKNKNWYMADYQHFQYWAKKVGVSWGLINPHLQEVMDKARTLWPTALDDLPMLDLHKTHLRQHWQKLSSDFRIEC